MVGGGAVELKGVLSIPEGAHAFVVIAYEGMGNAEPILGALNDLAVAIRRAGLACLLVNLLTSEDEVLDTRTGFFRENVYVLHQRMKGITDWLIAKAEPQSITIGYCGGGVSAAAALAAAALRPDAVQAIVAVAPRIDLVHSYLPRVVTPTLVIIAQRDRQALDMSRRALAELSSDTRLDNVREARERGLSHTLETIPGVANVFENLQSRQRVEQLATLWFTRYLSLAE